MRTITSFGDRTSDTSLIIASVSPTKITRSPRAGKGDPDCSKTKLTVRLHPWEYFAAFSTISVRMRDWLLGKNVFPRV